VSSRSTQARKLAFLLGQRWGIRVEADFHGRGEWTLQWSDGPTSATMRDAADELAPTCSPLLPAAGWRYERSVQPLAHAVQLVRAARAGKIDPYATRSQIEGHAVQAADHSDFPESPVDELELALASRLVKEAGGTSLQMAELVKANGIAWLLPDRRAPASDTANSDEQPVPVRGRGEPPDRTAALAELTTRYAVGAEAAAWRRELRALPVREAVERAAADGSAPAEVVAAALVLLPDLRCDLDRAELALIDRARTAQGQVGDALLSWAQLGRALGGITHQAAQQRRNRLQQALNNTDVTEASRGRGQADSRPGTTNP
jgi:hypothetical protein